MAQAEQALQLLESPFGIHDIEELCEDVPENREPFSVLDQFVFYYSAVRLCGNRAY